MNVATAPSCDVPELAITEPMSIGTSVSHTRTGDGVVAAAGNRRDERDGVAALDSGAPPAVPEVARCTHGHGIHRGGGMAAYQLVPHVLDGGAVDMQFAHTDTLAQRTEDEDGDVVHGQPPMYDISIFSPSAMPSPRNSE